jgi:predicted lipid-binding transport protein (Tim44 family)
MMKNVIALVVTAIGLSLAVPDVDAARRVGSGSSVGKQRSSITPPASKPAAPQTAAPATPAQQPSGMSRWLGPLAGLALGAGLASMFMNGGLGAAFGGILMMLLLAAAAIFAVRMFRNKQKPQPLQYAGAGAPGRVAQPDISNHFGGASAVTPAVPPAAARRYPPGFDADQFARHAKLNFTQLQAANDRHDLSAMRDFMTPQLYSEITARPEAQDTTPQKTEIVSLDADVLEVVTEGDLHIASVRFNGTIRETANTLAESFSEVWHLEKPVNGASGWLISGIQQD